MSNLKYKEPVKYSGEGTLKGACAPPLPGVRLPPRLDPTVTKYTLTVPEGKIGGGKMVVTMRDGTAVTVPIPRQRQNEYGKLQLVRPGDTFQFEWGDREKVIASTLPSLPGTTVVAAKPMVFSNCSYGFSSMFNPNSISSNIEKLMQQAQASLLQQAVQLGCNAVLGINNNVNTDSFGDGKKYMIVTMTGTPCVVMPLNNVPVVEAKATLIPDLSTL